VRLLSQTNAPAQNPPPSRSGLGSAAVIALVLVALVSLGFAGYTALNPHTTTVTEQQMVTNTQTVSSVQMQTVTLASTATSMTTVTNSQAGVSPYGYGYGSYYYPCDYYGCYYQSPGYYYNYPGYYNYGYGYYGYNPPCQSTGSNNNVTCSGYLNQASNGCTLLAIPTSNNPYPSYATTGVFEYYALHNMPSNAPSTGSWVTVTGQLYQGYNTASSGASCPNNYINVSSVS